MKKLIGFLFPVPYPLAAVFHIFLGAAVGCLIPQFIDGTDNIDGAVLGAAIGAGIGLVLGFLLWLVLKSNKSLNDKASVVLLLLLASVALSCQRTPQPVQGLTASEAELFPTPRLITDSAGWTRPALATAY